MYFQSEKQHVDEPWLKMSVSEVPFEADRAQPYIWKRVLVSHIRAVYLLLQTVKILLNKCLL